MGKESEEVKNQGQGRACVCLHDQQYEGNLRTHDRQGKSKRCDRFDELDIQYESLFAACGVRYVQEGKTLKSGC